MKIQWEENSGERGVRLWTTKAGNEGTRIRHLPIGFLIVTEGAFETAFVGGFDPKVVRSLKLRHRPLGKEVEEIFGNWVGAWGIKDEQLKEIFNLIRDHSQLTYRDIGQTNQDL